MTRHGEDFTLTQELMNDIASYMDDDIREELHSILAPCEPAYFLNEYIKRDPEILDILKNEFEIEM